MPRLLTATDKAIGIAAAALRRGNVVAFPTETVYGLGADTFNIAALQQVYDLKGRPADNPLIAHVSDAAQARRVAAAWDERCDRLTRRFWPGPLTIVVQRAEAVPDLATAGWPTIAIRSPDHPAALALLAEFGGPVSAPSANRSGHVSPTTAQHVADDFPDAGDLIILDGGPCAIGIESTVVDLSAQTPGILRPGAIPADAIRRVIGEVALSSVATQAHSPGTSPAHYAPHTATEIVAGEALADRLQRDAGPLVVLCFPGIDVPGRHTAIVMPDDPGAYAARLYGALREADRRGAARILIERPAARAGLWLAIHDRLDRAAGGQCPGVGRHGSG